MFWAMMVGFKRISSLHNKPFSEHIGSISLVLTHQNTII